MRTPLQALAYTATAPIRRWVMKTFPRPADGGIDYDRPPGDPGLFGPECVTWRIHADFPGMLSGGLAALMLQTLHPLALAGVWDHSNFRDDLIGRLRRTTTFVGATAFAPRAACEALIARVKHIHAQVHGRAEDGRRYAADDPDLLTWVHVTEASSFLQGFRRYGSLPVPADMADRYFDEVRRVAEALGARDVPGSQQAVADYFAAIRPQLAFGARGREVLDVLWRVRLPVPAAGVSRDLFLNAGAALLPEWADDLLQRSPRQRAAARVGARALAALAPLFRLALRDGVASRSCRRMGVDPSLLRRWPR